MQRARFLIGALVVTALLVVVDWFADGLSKDLAYGTARLQVTSEPSGAIVFVDGVRVGTTPLDARVRPGDVVVKIAHRFHEDLATRLTIARGEHAALALTLPAASGILHLVSNPKGAVLTLDGKPLADVTPHTVDPIVAGIHEVRFAIDERAPVVRTVEVSAAGEATLTVDLERIATGTLVVQTEPDDSQVTIEGGERAYRAGMELPIGEYRLVVARSGYAPEVRTVSVKTGQNLIEFELDRLFGTLRLQVVPRTASVEIRHGEGRLARSERYRDAMRLPAGRLEIKARASGYRRERREVELDAAGLDLTIRLARIDAQPGEVIRDPLRVGGEAPPMVVIGAARVRLGGQNVTFEQPFAIGVYEVRRADYRSYVTATGARMPEALAHETDDHPIVRVDRDDVFAYAHWLSAQTNQYYRLPSEAEWEYAARAGVAGTRTEADLCTLGNLADASAHRMFRAWDTARCDDGHVRTVPVGTYRANAFGLHDTVGNVAEWVLDCWRTEPAMRADGSADSNPDCVTYVVKGGSWDGNAAHVRPSAREPASRGGDDRGFRLLREF